MGLTPVEGLIMGTRSGDIDGGVITLLMEKEEIDFSSLNTLINKHSGLLGISGISSDMREIESAATEGNERAALSVKIFAPALSFLALSLTKTKIQEFAARKLPSVRKDRL